MSDQRPSLASLTPEQRAKLAARLAATPKKARDFPRKPDEAPDRLSPGQERLWRLIEQDDDSRPYAMTSLWRVSGPLDRTALSRAVDELLRRHDQLRTLIEAGVPRLSPATDGALTLVEATSEAQALTQIEAVARSLGRSRLFEVRLFQLGEELHVLALIAHHLICDAISLSVVESELGILYRAHLEGHPSKLEELPVRYTDYAHWAGTAPPDERALDFWRSYLEGVEPVRPPRAETEGSLTQYAPDGTSDKPVRLDFGVALSNQVDELSRGLRITPFALLAAALAVLLERHTGQRDLVIATPATVRRHSRLENVVGYFNDITLLRLGLQDHRLEQILADTQEQVAKALDHPGLAFQQIASLPQVRTVRLTNVIFGLVEHDSEGPAFPGATTEKLELDLGGSPFRLGFYMSHSSSYRLSLAFDAHSTSRPEVDEIAQRYVEIVRRIVESPSQLLSALPAFHSAPESPVAGDTDSSPARQPRSLLEARLQSIWSNTFETPVGLHDDFFEIGGHSMLAAQLMDAVERELVGKRMPLAMLFEAPTIAQLADRIETGGWDGSWSSLVPIKPDGSRTPLFFVHGHGGNAIGFRDLARCVDPDRPFYGLQTPNMDQPDPVTHRIEDIAAHYLNEIQTVQETGPYLLGGFCLGATIAYAMARLLAEQGHEVALVVMVSNPRIDVLRERAGLGADGPLVRARRRLAKEWTVLWEKAASSRPRYFRARSAELTSRVLVSVEERLVRPDGQLPFGIRHSRAYLADEVGRAHEKAYEAYDPPPYRGTLAVIQAAREWTSRLDDPTFGWGELVDGPIHSYSVAGYRLGVLDPPVVTTVGRAIEEAITAAGDARDSAA